MANKDAPFGLRIYNSNGAPYTGRLTRYKKTASVILGIGDPVVAAGDGDADGIPLVTRASSGAGNKILGVVVSTGPLLSDLSKNYLASADSGDVLVADDPDLIFEIQEDSDGGALAATDIERGADLVAAIDASTTTGLSKYEIDSSTVGTGSTVQLKLLGLVERPDNAIGNQAVWRVMISQHANRAALILS